MERTPQLLFFFSSLVRYSHLHFHLSHMAVHHHLLHHLHYHHLHLLSLVQSYILNLRLGSSANPFLHRPSPFLPDWFHGPSNVFILLSGWIYLFAWCVGLSRLLVGFRTHLKIKCTSTRSFSCRHWSNICLFVNVCVGSWCQLWHQRPWRRPNAAIWRRRR